MPEMRRLKVQSMDFEMLVPDTLACPYGVVHYAEPNAFKRAISPSLPSEGEMSLGCGAGSLPTTSCRTTSLSSLDIRCSFETT